LNTPLQPLLGASIDPNDPFGSVLDNFGHVAFQGLIAGFWLLVVPCIAGGFILAIYYFLSLPLRRQERARLFLDLIETGLKDGRSPEQTIKEVGQTRDGSVGVRFHLLAAWLERGLRLPEALAKVPGLLPPNVAATLRVGVELGDLARVLPAARALLGDGVSKVRKAHSYLFVLLFSSTFKVIAITGVLFVFVVPKFEEIFKDLLEGESLPTTFHYLAEWRAPVSLMLVAITVMLWLGAAFYIGGPRLRSAVEGMFPRLGAWLSTATPWQRKRLKRDFSSLLASFLDAGVPEERAVTLAAEGTASLVMRERAARVGAELRAGVKLAEAIRHMDDSGEFRWRLANAARGKGGFLAALAAWHDALDAKAFQQEQSNATVVTSGLVLLNGFVVGFVILAIFQTLSVLIDSATLW